MKRIISLFLAGLCISTMFMSCDDKLTESGNYYTEIITEDLTLIPVWYEDDDCYVYVNLDGEIVLNDDYQSANYFLDGIALVRRVSNYNEYYYIDKKGNQIGTGEYYEADLFFNGYAAVKKTNSSGYMFINKNGEHAIDGTYARVSGFSEGLVAVKDEQYLVNSVYNYNNNRYEYNYDFYYFIDKNGDKIIDNENYVKANMFYKGYSVVAVADDINASRYTTKYGLINKSGEAVVDFDYEHAAGYCTEGLLAVYENNRWGYVDTKGHEIIDFDYENAVPFMEGYAAVSEDYNKWYFIDKNGDEVNMPYEFEAINLGFSEGLAAVKFDGKWGYINKSGEFVIEPQFLGEPSPFINGYACLYDGGVINKKGVVLFSSSSPIVEKSMTLNNNTYNSNHQDLKRVLFK